MFEMTRNITYSQMKNYTDAYVKDRGLLIELYHAMNRAG
jgi:hypothetical protein